MKLLEVLEIWPVLWIHIWVDMGLFLTCLTVKVLEYLKYWYEEHKSSMEFISKKLTTAIGEHPYIEAPSGLHWHC